MFKSQYIFNLIKTSSFRLNFKNKSKMLTIAYMALGQLASIIHYKSQALLAEKYPLLSNLCVQLSPSLPSGLYFKIVIPLSLLSPPYSTHSIFSTLLLFFYHYQKLYYIIYLFCLSFVSPTRISAS